MIRRSGVKLIEGERVVLRLIEERDLDELYRHKCKYRREDVFVPRSVYSMTRLRRRFERDGFWSARDTWVLLPDLSDRILGCLYYFRPHPILLARELAYIVFEPEDRGNGYATEALTLFVELVFRTTRVNRLELNIGTENLPSVRVAEKAGFNREAVLHGVWYAPALNRYVDCYRYALLRDTYSNRDKSPK
ncbi:MAG TPA: GNAT family protein [Spirochaetia bacterium]|nr:GNAT family protein [Spirochaetia bacterium]